MKFERSECSASPKVPDTLPGKRAKCPKCRAVIEIPVLPLESAGPSGPPATEKQKEYPRSLGIDFPPDITKKEINALISKGVDREDEERFTKLDQLGDRESQAYQVEAHRNPCRDRRGRLPFIQSHTRPNGGGARESGQTERSSFLSRLTTSTLTTLRVPNSTFPSPIICPRRRCALFYLLWVHLWLSKLADREMENSTTASPGR